MDTKTLSYSFMCVGAYNASALYCYAFRRGTDERKGITLSPGILVSGYLFMPAGVAFPSFGLSVTL